jgi:hypothetical protein
MYQASLVGHLISKRQPRGVNDMDSNTIGQADIAVATMRALPWRVKSSSSWQPLPKTAASGAQTGVHAIALPVVGSYVVSAPAATNDRVAQLCVMGADHKFSTRLGPSASPPV